MNGYKTLTHLIWGVVFIVVSSLIYYFNARELDLNFQRTMAEKGYQQIVATWKNSAEMPHTEVVWQKIKQ